MRLFVAVDVDDATRRRMSVRVGQLRQLLTMMNRDLVYAVNWVPADKLHVTLHFLGEVERERLSALRAGLAPALDLAPFRMTFGSPGVFPHGRQPRVIWLDVDLGREALRTLHDEIGARLQALGVPVDARPFTAHLTLARLKWPVHLDLDALLETVPSDDGTSVLVDHATLYRSELSPQGATYGAMLRIPFAC